MDISHITDLESLGFLDMQFRLGERRTHTTHYPSQLKRALDTTHRYLCIQATLKWHGHVKKHLYYPLDAHTAQLLELNWPDTTGQLQTLMMLAGAHDVWMELENDIVGEYNKHNSHNGALANVRS